MGQRQPHRADLLPAGRHVVEDAPRDDEVRLRVVVAQDETGPEEDEPPRDAGECGSRGKYLR